MWRSKWLPKCICFPLLCTCRKHLPLLNSDALHVITTTLTKCAEWSVDLFSPNFIFLSLDKSNLQTIDFTLALIIIEHVALGTEALITGQQTLTGSHGGTCVTQAMVNCCNFTIQAIRWLWITMFMLVYISKINDLFNWTHFIIMQRKLRDTIKVLKFVQTCDCPIIFDLKRFIKYSCSLFSL